MKTNLDLTFGSSCADDIRNLGLSVAVHNDYRLHGERNTFWLFVDEKTRLSYKGEGNTDSKALDQVREQLYKERPQDLNYTLPNGRKYENIVFIYPVNGNDLSEKHAEELRKKIEGRDQEGMHYVVPLVCMPGHETDPFNMNFVREILRARVQEISDFMDTARLKADSYHTIFPTIRSQALDFIIYQATENQKAVYAAKGINLIVQEKDKDGAMLANKPRFLMVMSEKGFPGFVFPVDLDDSNINTYLKNLINRKC